MDRRNFLRTCAFTTGVVGLSFEEKALLAQPAKAKESKPSAASIVLPMGQIGKLHMAIDAGAQGAFIQGGMDDRLTQQSRLDLVARVTEHAQKSSLKPMRMPFLPSAQVIGG